MNNNILLELACKYGQSYRRYHNLEHVGHMFAMANKHCIVLSDVEIYAVWFHDIIYVPGASDNEELSAVLAGKLLAEDGILNDECILAVQRIIRDTKTHLDVWSGSANVVDLDLYDLSQSASVFMGNGQKIQDEYFLYFKNADKNEFFEKRLKWMKWFIERKRIYSGFMDSDENDLLARKNFEYDIKMNEVIRMANEQKISQ